MADSDPWPEEDDLQCLESERRAYAWAMLGLKGAYYWRDHPEFAEPPAEHRALD